LTILLLPVFFVLYKTPQENCRFTDALPLLHSGDHEVRFSLQALLLG
jgi:hypothetical protein